MLEVLRNCDKRLILPKNLENLRFFIIHYVIATQRIWAENCYF